MKDLARGSRVLSEAASLGAVLFGLSTGLATATLALAVALFAFGCQQEKPSPPPTARPAPAPSAEDLVVLECKRLLLERYGGRLRGRRFPPRREVSVVHDGDAWEVLFLTRPGGAQFPLLSAGCEGMRRSSDGWTAEKVLIHG